MMQIQDAQKCQFPTEGFFTTSHIRDGILRSAKGCEIWLTKLIAMMVAKKRINVEPHIVDNLNNLGQLN